ncbi:MAG: glycosyltransferase family 39 protein [Chloroflexota bacterium]
MSASITTPEPPPPNVSLVPDDSQPACAAQVNLRLEVELPPGVSLNLTVESRAPQGETLESRSLTLSNPPVPLPDWLANAPRPARASRAQRWLVRLRAQPLSLSAWLLAAAVLVYAATRLIGLADFPIYFFTDEAAQTVLAADLLRDGLRGYTGVLLPTYFPNGTQYNLSLSVYLQVLPYLLFGKSVLVTRTAAALVTVISALAVGLTLKQAFGSRAAWGGVLLLTLTPVWLLHSRTAFETALAVSFYAAFLYAYLRYRQGAAGWVYGMAVFAALTFYSYSPAQMVLFVTVVLLFFSDLRYHWQQRNRLAGGLALGLMFALPYARFQADHPGETLRHLAVLNSYWLSDQPFLAKLGIYFREYLSGLNPLYWFNPNPAELVRHVMPGYGHLGLWALPFIALGLARAARRIRQPEYRLLLLAVLAAPAGAALVQLGVTRALFMVIPAALLGGLGLESALDWLGQHGEKRLPALPVRSLLAGLVFVVMVAGAFAMLGDALVNAPTWFDDYGMAGMQWGARQLFAAAKDYLAENPGVDLIISPSWANGSDVLARFFADDPQPYRLGSIEGYLDEYKPLDENTRFVMIPDEWRKVQESDKFSDVQVERTLLYPNGEPGFYFVRLRYVDNAAQLFAAEDEQRRRLIQGVVMLPDGAPVTARHSQLDMGEIFHAFDGDANTLTRSLEANPLLIRLTFDAPRELNGLTARIGGVPGKVVVWVQPPDGSAALPFEQEKEETPDPRDVRVEFGQTLTTRQVEVEIWSTRDTGPAHVHLWEITFH